MSDAPKKRGLRFSLRTLLVAISVSVAGSYWVAQQVRYKWAADEYERAYAAWECEIATTASVCEASRRLFRAESAVPFADRGQAAATHLARIDKVRHQVYVMTERGLFANEDDPPRMRAEIDRYYEDAARLAEPYLHHVP